MPSKLSPAKLTWIFVPVWLEASDLPEHYETSNILGQRAQKSPPKRHIQIFLSSAEDSREQADAVRRRSQLSQALSWSSRHNLVIITRRNRSRCLQDSGDSAFPAQAEVGSVNEFSRLLVAISITGGWQVCGYLFEALFLAERRDVMKLFIDSCNE